MEELKSSSIHRNLETKLRIGGMEAADLLFVLLFASVMNVIFGSTSLALYLVFLLPSTMAIALYFGKRGKPDNYLIHLLRFYSSAGHYSAAESPESESRRKISIVNG